jgi:hypothetical protein
MVDPVLHLSQPWSTLNFCNAALLESLKNRYLGAKLTKLAMGNLNQLEGQIHAKQGQNRDFSTGLIDFL